MFEAQQNVVDAITQLEALVFDKQVFRHQVYIGLCASMLERCHTILSLVEQGKGFDAEIILRSALEHFVELQNLCDDENYHLHLQAGFLRGINHQLNQARAGNPFYAKIAKNLPVDQELATTADKVREVAALGGKNLSITDKFKRAGLPNEYESIFRSLSSQVHPTYAGIIKRHFEIDETTGDFCAKGVSNTKPTIYRRACGYYEPIG